jgi:hypothetical protein
MDTIIRYAPAASNYYANIGDIVYDSGVASSKPRATLTADGSVCPLGVIIDAANENGGRLVIQCFGRGRVNAGAAITLGTNVLIMANAAARAIPATDGNFYLGRFVGEATAASGDLVDCIIQPGYLENT